MSHGIRVESPSKRGFDLEVVLEGFQNTRQPDGTLVTAEYLKGFCELCRFFRVLGRVFNFVAKDLEWKTSVIQKRMHSSDYGEHYGTMQDMVRYELSQGITGQRGDLPSGSRTLIRLQRALEFIIIFMGELGQCRDDAKASKIAWGVYKRTLAKHHIKPIKAMAAVAVHMLPTRRQIFELMCKQEPAEVVHLMERVVQVAQPLYDNINALLAANNLSHIP